MVILLKGYLYKQNVTKFLWPELSILARTFPAECPCREPRPTGTI